MMTEGQYIIEVITNTLSYIHALLIIQYNEEASRNLSIDIKIYLHPNVSLEF
jgi:hypothetical protein